MLTIQTNQLKDLMTLAADVRNRSGRLLAAKGMVLTKEHLRVFKTWGVKEVEIIDSDNAVIDTDDRPSETTIDQEKLSALIEEEKPRFSLNPLEHPLISELIRLSALERLARQQ